ncbi:MBL fold metallo-hydrolase [Bacillus thuringiensis]|uniref:MBL fold metallo-hydrolase n=1 Tax=Bacillus thuringiensis TaxID=1428 RepID=UPI0026988CAB
MDCLTSAETAKAALKLVNEYFGNMPISAIILTHSHTDHYSGILCVLYSDTEKKRVCSRSLYESSH